MSMVKVKATYTRGRMRDRIDKITVGAKVEGLDDDIHALAERVVAYARSVIDSQTPADASEANTFTTAYDSLQVVDGGKDYHRRRYPSGSIIPVALVAPVGGAKSAELVEYGHGTSPGVYPLTKAVLALGGTTL